MNGALRPTRSDEGALVPVFETLFDMGLVLNADIMVAVAGVDLRFLAMAPANAEGSGSDS